MSMFEQLNELKINFNPSLDRSWCEIFKIIKDHGVKNQPQGVILGAILEPSLNNLI